MLSWVPVAHACNPSYSGGRDQEDHGSKLAPANCSSGRSWFKAGPGKLFVRPYLENTHDKKKGWWSGSRFSSTPKTKKKKKKKKRKEKEKERKETKILSGEIDF
jgi:hypothetical protein